MTLHIESLNVRLGGHDVLIDVSLDVAAGERLAVMGPSGAGKSTLLRATAGLVAVRSGTIEVAGNNMADAPPHLRPVGLMFQDYALFPHMDVRSNVAYGLRMQDIPRADALAQADGLLDLVGMADHRNRLPANLSGGEQQRVALARTLAPRPAVVLFDEPLGSLDLDLKSGLIVEMRRIVDELGIASVYVTHDRDEAVAFGHRIAILRDGLVVRDGSPEDLWNDPRTSFVARFIGHNTVAQADALGLGRGPIAIPLAAVAISDDGDIEGTVTSCVFDAGNYRVRIDVDGSAVELRSTGPRSVGEDVRVAMDATRIIRLEPDGP